MNYSETINLYKIRFKNALIGKWITIEGSFTMQSDMFEFFENGTGYWVSSGLSYSDTFYFNWREKAPFIIELKEEESDDWFEVKYDFKQVKTDIGEAILLCQNNTDTFYLAVTKIGYGEII